MRTNVKVFNVGRLLFKNQCYLAYKNNIGVLIDPAWEYNFIEDFLKENDIKVKAILLTHSHSDHTNLANEFAVNKNIPVYMSATEIDNYNFSCFNLEKVRHLNEITINSLEILPIITPGHTLGSTCYLIDNHIFSGDTVFIEGVGICNYYNAYALYNSIQFLKENLLKTTLFWPGHSFGELPGKDLGYLLKHNIYFQFKEKQHFIDFRMRKNRPPSFNFK